MKLIFLILLSFNIAMADCSKEVQHIEQGIVAPCSGYLFSEAKELETRIKIREAEIVKKLLDNEKDINLILQKRIDNTAEYIEDLEKSRDQQFWKNTAYFVLGALVTGYIATNVGR